MKSFAAYIILILLSCCTTSVIFSQNVKIDSLRNELINHTKADTSKVNLITSVLKHSYRVDLNTSDSLIEQAEILSNKLNFKKGKADVVFWKGKVEFEKANYVKSLAHFEKAIEMFQSVNYKAGIESTYYAIGKIYLAEGNYDKAIAYYEKSANISNELNDLDHYANIISSIANLYANQGKFPKSLEYYNKALEAFMKNGDKAGEALTLLQLGGVYYKQSDDEQALIYFNKSLELSKKLDNKNGMAQSLYGMAHIYKEKLEYQKALSFLNESLAIYEELDYTDGEARVYIALADIYLLLNQGEEALENNLKALEINQEIGSPVSICNSYLTLSRVYLLQKKYPEALESAFKGQEIAKELSLLLHEKELYEILSMIYEETGDYKNAFESHQQFKILNDSLFNEENIEKITQLEYEYKYKQELDSANYRELKLSQKVTLTNRDLAKSQRNYLWAIIIALMIAIVLGGTIFYLRLRNVKSKTQNIIIEQKLLRSQMTPHFIFNSLSVLQGMILNKEEKKSVTYLSKFSKLLRIILENSRFKTVTLNDELSAIENYLALQNLENEDYQYTIVVDENMDGSSFKIPPMLIQPFVENAIEHAFANHSEIKKIDIHVSLKEDLLICTITDNGIGIGTPKENQRKDKNSLSTVITSERLQMISKDFKKDGSVTIEDRNKYNEKGTIVTMVIPYIN